MRTLSFGNKTKTSLRVACEQLSAEGKGGSGGQRGRVLWRTAMSAADSDRGGEDLKKSALMHKIITSAKKKIEESEKVCASPRSACHQQGALQIRRSGASPAPLEAAHA